MRRFVFSLEQLLKVKEQHERLAKLRQQQALVSREAAAAQVLALEQILADAAVRVQRPDGVDPVALATRQEHASRLATRLHGARVAEQRAFRELEEATRRLRQAAVDVEALLTLRQQQWQEHRRTLLRQQQEQLDDHGMRAWRGGRPGDGREVGKGGNP